MYCSIADMVCLSAHDCNVAAERCFELSKRLFQSTVCTFLSYHNGIIL